MYLGRGVGEKALAGEELEKGIPGLEQLCFCEFSLFIIPHVSEITHGLSLSELFYLLITSIIPSRSIQVVVNGRVSSFSVA